MPSDIKSDRDQLDSQWRPARWLRRAREHGLLVLAFAVLLTSAPSPAPAECKTPPGRAASVSDGRTGSVIGGGQELPNGISKGQLDANAPYPGHKRFVRAAKAVQPQRSVAVPNSGGPSLGTAERLPGVPASGHAHCLVGQCHTSRHGDSTIAVLGDAIGSKVHSENKERSIVQNSRKLAGRIARTSAIPYQVMGCHVLDVSPNGTYEGRLQAGDCSYRQLVDVEDDYSYVDQYRVTLSSRGRLVARMSSNSMKSYVEIRDATWSLADKGGGDQGDAVVSSILPAGSYTVLANSWEPATGSYELTLSYIEERASCQTFPIGVNESRQGNLSPTSCRVVDFAWDYFQGFADRYRVVVLENGKLSVVVRSDSFDTIIGLYDEDMNIIAVNDDSEGTNSAISVFLRPGTYYVIAADYNYNDKYGIYTITVDFQPDRANCTPSYLRLGSTVDGVIFETDCRVPYFRSDYYQGSADLYELIIPQFGRLNLRLESTDFDAVLELFDQSYNQLAWDDDSGEGTNAEIAGDIRPGRYIVGAETLRAYETGRYQLSALFEPIGKRCSYRSLTAGQAMGGELSSSDCSLGEYWNSSDASYVDPYWLQVLQRGRLVVSMSSTEIDSFVILRTDWRTYTDDDSGGGLNARLEVVLQPGTYVVLANSASEETQTGTYTISTEFEPLGAPRCGVSDLAGTDRRTGFLGPMGCHTSDLGGSAAWMQSWVDQYRVRLPRRSVLNVEMVSSDFEPLVRSVEEHHGTLVFGVSESHSAQGAYVLAPGDYILQALSNRFNRIGSYELRNSITPREARCVINDLPASAVARGTISGNDCVVSDLARSSYDPTPARGYRITVPERGELSVKLSSSNFDTYLWLLDGRRVRIIENDDWGEETNSAITWFVTPGTYWVIATSFDGSEGDYLLELDFTPQYSGGSSRGGRVHLPLLLRGQYFTLLPDGGFERGVLEGPWRRGGELPSSLVTRTHAGDPAFEGVYSALLGQPAFGSGASGDVPAGSAWIERLVRVPDWYPARLTFAYRLVSYDVARGSGDRLWDTFDVTADGQVVFRWGSDLRPGEQGARAYDSGWRLGSVDLSGWRGQAVTLRFAAWNREYDGNGRDFFNTWAYVDAVELH